MPAMLSTNFAKKLEQKQNSDLSIKIPESLLKLLIILDAIMQKYFLRKESEVLNILMFLQD